MLRVAQSTRAGRVGAQRALDIAEQPIMRYWSVVGPAEDIDERSLLEENASLSYGAFAIRTGNLVVVDTQLIEDADPGEVGSALSNIAAVADRYERELFGHDVF